MASSTTPTQAMCLLFAVVVVTLGGATSAAAARPIPGSCLMAASTLCANADTNAMRCLRKLAMKSDARVPSACAAAIMAGANPRLNQASRAKRMYRLLNEGGDCGANICPGDFNSQNSQCNDANNGCSGCPKGTYTIESGLRQNSVATSSKGNPNSVNCSNMCCKAANGGPACCVSYSTSSIYCVGSGGGCNPG